MGSGKNSVHLDLFTSMSQKKRRKKEASSLTRIKPDSIVHRECLIFERHVAGFNVPC